MADNTSLGEDADGVVGVGPEYAGLRAEAKRLVPLFAPAGIENSQSSWGIGLDGMVRPEGDQHLVSLLTEFDNWTKKALARERPSSLRELRAAAISLLVYCEAHDG